MASTRETTRMTIEQIFTIRDQETERRGLGPYDDDDMDPWDDGEGDWQEDWQEEEEEDSAAHLVVVAVSTVKKVRPVKWEQVAGDKNGDIRWVRTGHPVVKETHEVSGEDWFLNNVVEKGLVGAMCVPHDLWEDAIVPLAIVKRRKKMTCIVMSDKKLYSCIYKMVEARDLRFQLSRRCVRLPTSDCINYGRLMVSVLYPTTFSKDFSSIDTLLLFKNDVLKIGSLEFIWTIVDEDEYGGPVDPYYTHRLKPSYTYDERGQDESWNAVIDEIDSSSKIKIREQAIEQELSFEQILHIFMKRDFNLDS